MKKGLSLVLSAAIALSAFAPAAFAAEAAAPKTPQEFYDVLKEKGIFDGYEDGSAGLDKTMTRAEVTKVLVKLLGLTEAAAEAAVYTDLEGAGWAEGYIGAATKAKIMDGVAEGQFDPSGTFTLEQLAAVMVRALGLVESTDAVEGTVSPWAQGYVGAAIKAGLIQASADYTQPAIREVLVATSFAAYTAIQDAVKADVSAKAVAANKIEVTFNKAVDTSKAVFAVKNGNNTVNVKTKSFNDAGTVATLEFANKLAAAEYTISVTGLSDTALTATVKVEAEKVTKIDFQNDKLVLDRAVGTNMTAKGSVKIYNQYNVDVTKDYNDALTITAGKGTGTVDDNGVLTLNAGAAYTLDEKVAVSVLHAGSTTFQSAVLTVSPKAQVSSVEVTKLIKTTGDNVDAAPVAGDDAANFSLVVVAKDQYGNVVTEDDYLQEDLIVTSSNPAVAGILTTTVGGSTYADFAENIKSNKTVLALKTDSAKLGAGTATVTMISKYTANKSTFDVVVKDAAKVDSITLNSPELAVAGEKVAIPFTAVDQFGNEVAHPISNAADAANNSLTSINSSNSLATVNFKKDVVNNKTTLELDLTNVNAAGTVIITAITKTNKVVQLNVNVVAPKKPTVIAGVKDIKAAFLKGNIVEFDADNVVINDQYGRAMGLPAGYTITAESSDDAKLDVAAELASGTTLSAVTKGSYNVTLTLKKGADVVSNSSYTYGVKVVEKAEIKSYEASVTGTVYSNADAKYAKALTVEGALEDGTKVAVYNDAANYEVRFTTASAGLSFSGGKIYATGYNYGTDKKDVEVPVIVAVKAASGTELVTVNVKISNKTPVVTTLALKASADIGITDAVKEADGLLSVNLADLSDINEVVTLVNKAVSAKDQYGAAISETFTVSNVFVTGLSDLTAAGKSITVTAISGNGVVITFKVIAK